MRAAGAAGRLRPFMTRLAGVEMKTQTRWPLLVVVALAVVAAGHRWGSLATTARADTSLAITADQPLVPAFNSSVHDYAVRCGGAPDVGQRPRSVFLTLER